MRQRLMEMDYMRTIAALSVVAIHVTAQYVNSVRAAYYLNQVVRFAVPLFIIMSGMLLYLSVDNCYGLKGYKSFIQKRMKKILIPYLVWSLIYIAYSMRYSIMKGETDKRELIGTVLNKILLGTGYDHLYFIIIILQLYLLYPLLKYCMEKSAKVTVISSLFITVTFQTVLYLRVLHMVRFPEFIIPYYMLFPTWIFYFVFGMQFASKVNEWRNFFAGKTFIFAGTWVISLFILIIDNRYTNTASSSIKPSVMLYCLATFILLYTIFIKFQKASTLSKVVGWLSVQSFIVYFSHLLVMNFIMLLPLRFGISILSYGFIGMVALYITTIVFTSMAAYIVSKTPAAMLFGGVNMKVPKRN